MVAFTLLRHSCHHGNVTKFRCNLCHSKNQKFQLSCINLNVECVKEVMYSQNSGFAAKDNGIDETTIKWGKITK